MNCCDHNQIHSIAQHYQEARIPTPLRSIPLSARSSQAWVGLLKVKSPLPEIVVQGLRPGRVALIQGKVHTATRSRHDLLIEVCTYQPRGLLAGITNTHDFAVDTGHSNVNFQRQAMEVWRMEYGVFQKARRFGTCTSPNLSAGFANPCFDKILRTSPE